MQRTVRFREVDRAVVTQDAFAVAVQPRRTGAAFIDGFGTTLFIVDRIIHSQLTSDAEPDPAPPAVLCTLL